MKAVVRLHADGDAVAMTAHDATEQPETFPIEDLKALDVIATSEDGQVSLRGSRCTGCSDLSFPARSTCPRCHSSSQEEFFLGRRGTVYAFSTVRVSSSRDVPYTLAFVDLPSGTRILTRLTSGQDVSIGDDVVLSVRSADDWGFKRAT